MIRGDLSFITGVQLALAVTGIIWPVRGEVLRVRADAFSSS
jgi:hypothetical protein